MTKSARGIASDVEKREIYEKNKRGKCYAIVDTIGDVLAVAVHVANILNTMSGILAEKNIHPLHFQIKGESYGK